MYAMPNIGESVMLYSPNRYDETIVTGCVRKNGNSCSKISNTNNRYFSTESGNNLDILPGAINFYRSGMNVNLNDENGVNISSSGNLSLGASGGISLSGGSVSISGSNKVLVQKNKSSYISLEGECYNQSNAVYENGSCRETYEPFTDDDPQNGVAEALAELEYKNELLSLSILGSNVMLNVVMQSNMYNGIPKSGVALKNRSDIEVFDSKKVYKGTLVKTQAGDDEFILGKAYPTCNGSVFVPVDYNLASKHIGSFGKHLQSFGNALMGVATKGYYDTLALVASLDGILSFDQDKRLNAMSASAEYFEEGKKANEYYRNKSQYKQAYDAYSTDINLFMEVKGVGNICKSPGNISNMGSGSLPMLNGTKGTLAISTSVEIADIGVAVRTGIGGAELGLGAYNFSKGSNNGSSKEPDKNNNAANKKESSSNNKDIDNKVQGNETKAAGKTVEEVKYGNQYTRVNGKKVLKPDVEYTTKEGYKYKTNSSGSIEEVEGTLKLGDGKRSLYAQRTAGGDYRLPDDDGGHLIGSQFLGSGKIDNLVPMNSQINRAGGKWYNMETEWANALKQGKDVQVKIHNIYEPNNLRPVSFKIKYTIEGERTKIIKILNKSGG